MTNIPGKPVRGREAKRIAKGANCPCPKGACWRTYDHRTCPVRCGEVTERIEAGVFTGKLRRV